MRQPKFNSNLEDNLHCLQACIKMVFDTLNITKSWVEIDKMVSYEPQLYSWSVAGAKALADYIGEVKMYSVLNYLNFATKGKAYLKEAWPQGYYDNQKKHASPDFKREQALAKSFLKNGNVENHNLGLNEIVDFLNRNKFVIALCDPHVLNNEQSQNKSHFILLFKQDNNNFFYHDPGLPAVQNKAQNKLTFQKAFQHEAVIVPHNLDFSEQLGRNDPCWCGAINPKTGQVYKYKKCGLINALYHKG